MSKRITDSVAIRIWELVKSDQLMTPSATLKQSIETVVAYMVTQGYADYAIRAELMSIADDIGLAI